MRYEIKYVYPPDYGAFLVRDVLAMPGMFREIFGERQVNNVYFDMHGLEDYRASVEGAPNRSKVRIRWYGGIGEIVAPALEHKLKHGMVGSKNVTSLGNFTLGGDNDLQGAAAALLSNRRASLVNSYRRRYFSNPDNSCRITVDWDMRYYDPGWRLGEPFGIADSRIILEVKFDKEDLPIVSKITQHISRRVGKNSKYVCGINAVIFGNPPA
jgi:hypothetical protein